MLRNVEGAGIDKKQLEHLVSIQKFVADASVTSVILKNRDHFSE
jgi:hypothetical protein